MNDWQAALSDLDSVREYIREKQRLLQECESEATSTIAQYLRAAGGVDLNIPAIKASVAHPYILRKIPGTQEALLYHWRGVNMPIFGWIESQDEVFTVARITRTMDLLTPFPEWVKQEMEWTPPAHQALIDGAHTSIKVTEGDAETFKRKYGAHLGKKREDGSFEVKKGDAWIKLVASLIKDGILPYQPKPVEEWDEDASPAIDPARGTPIAMRDYQESAVREFRDKGAILLNHPTGAGKSYVVLHIIAHLKLRTLILTDTTTALEQWKGFLERSVPQAEVMLSTYQGAFKLLKEKFGLLVMNECHRAPANTFSKLAFIDAKYRIGDTATAWREDDKQFMIAALSGFPVHLPWAELLRAGVLKKPRVVVATVKDDAGKTAYVKHLLGKGRTLVFCDWIERGQALANELGVPFVHGETRKKLEIIQDNPVCVVSRVADTSLDLPDLRMVIDYGFQSHARTQAAQRLGRLLHGEKPGEYWMLLTQEEAAREPKRLLGIEAELAGTVDIEFINAAPAKEREIRVKLRRVTREPKNEAESALSQPAVLKKIAEAESYAGATVRHDGTVTAVLKRAWDTPLDLEAFAAVRGSAQAGRYRAACKACIKAKLMLKVGEGYLANRKLIQSLIDLSEKYRR